MSRKITIQVQIAGRGSTQLQAGGNIEISGLRVASDLAKILINVCKKQADHNQVAGIESCISGGRKLLTLYDSFGCAKPTDHFLSRIEAFPSISKPHSLSSRTRDDISLLKSFADKDGSPIRISACTWFVAAAAILCYMRSIDIPLEFDFNYAHSGQTAIELWKRTRGKTPHVAFIADGPSSYLLKHQDSRPSYVPISFGPPCEHKIALHKDARRVFRATELSGEFHVVNYHELVSTPRIHLANLLDSNIIRKNNVKVVHTEPGTQIALFKEGAREIRSILCDPQWQIIRHWRPDAISVFEPISMWSEVLICAHDEFAASPECAAFLRLFNDCWYDIKFGLHSTLQRATAALVDHEDYGRLLLWFCGLK